MRGGQSIEADASVELEMIVSGAERDLRAHRFVREGAAVAIAGHGVDAPLARRSEVELMVRGLRIQRDESFEAGVAPEFATDAWCNR